MDQKQSTDHNSDADTESIERKRNVIGALLEHFKKWHPEAIERLEKLTPEGRSTETKGALCLRHIRDASNT